MKNALEGVKGIKRISGKSVILFLLTFALCAVLIGISVINKTQAEVLKMEQLILEKGTKANQVISRLLYKTQTLSALVIQNQGEIQNFEQIAALLVDDPAILNVLLAPDGVVTHIYPLAGNESLLGWDFFSEGAGNKEAVMAKETGQLVFGGPFNAQQGVQILVGRMPVIREEPDGTEAFWGLVSVTLKYPQALDGAGLNELHLDGFAYEVWRIDPDTGGKQVITKSEYPVNENVHYVEKHIPIQNADWYFRILPVRAWYEYPDTWLLVFLNVCVSFLVAFVTQSNTELRILKTNYEKLSHTDPLTGVYNRRYFMDFAVAQIERALHAKQNAFVAIFDLDFFKHVNDEYGHAMGDEVLIWVAGKVGRRIRPYDVLARFGGEEFVLLFTGISKPDACGMVERIRQNLAKSPMVCGDITIPVTASFGLAEVASVEALAEALDRADQALYQAKDRGRNQVVFYEG